jgi:ribulose 1,5-bisphosphate synthetase/thiazole synthase
MNLSRRSLIKNYFLAIFAANIGFPGKPAQGSPLNIQKGSFRFSRDIPIIERYDLVVAGGGPGGVSAAICAARLGARVLLIEATGCLGGMGTSGLVSHWAYMTDGKHSHANGIFMEILIELYKKDALSLKGNPTTWGTILHALTNFQPEPLKMILDKMCIEAGVDILFSTKVIDADVDTQKKKVNGVIIQHIGGYNFIKARVYIDATGDGTLADLCGVPSRRAGMDTEHIRPSTLCGLVTGIHGYSGNEKQEKVLEAIKDGFFSQADRHVPGIFLATPDCGILNAGHIFDMDALNIRSLSEGYITGRKLAAEYTEFFNKYVSGTKNIKLLTTASLIGVRESRNVYGEYELTYEDFKSKRHFPDQIAVHCRSLDNHPYNTSDEEYNRYLKEFKEMDQFDIGETYGMPYGMLVPKGWTNLWVSGRCVSVVTKVQGSVRGQPGCYMLGQAAGTAAAQSIKTGQAANLLDTEQLVKTLRDNGAYLPQEKLTSKMTRN